VEKRSVVVNEWVVESVVGARRSKTKIPASSLGRWRLNVGNMNSGPVIIVTYMYVMNQTIIMIKTC